MSVLSLVDAKTHLNITTSENDAELQSVIDAAEAAIARRVGPLTPTAYTLRVRGGSDTLVLPITPVLSLTSVTPVGGDALEISELDATDGLATYEAGGSFGSRLYDVTYMAGRVSVPDDLLLGIKEMVRHLWRSQRGSARPSAEAPSVPTFAIPYFVAEVIGPYVQVGFA